MLNLSLGVYVGGFLALIGLLICIYWYIYWEKNFQGELLTEGPYSVVRHPFYLGFIIFVIGLAVVLPYYEARLLVVFTLAVMVVYIPKEEEQLLKEYGEKYTRYMEKVPWRLLPYLY